MSVDKIPEKLETVSVVSNGWLGGFWQRIDVHPEYIAHYRLLPRRVGLVLKVATDGTPWTRNGKRYHVAISEGWWRFALGKYAVGILWRTPLPNTEVSNPAPQETQ